jgi:hypothetical protein
LMTSTGNDRTMQVEGTEYRQLNENSSTMLPWVAGENGVASVVSSYQASDTLNSGNIVHKQR